ncbi:MAG TPA: hypothetical protein PKA64_19690 [Myxococcota bacterium]|nr:hypothetical protein [Myxococcota bacterium]
MLVRAMGLVIAVLSSGCASYMVQMKVSAEDGGPDYVIMRVNGNAEKVFDCLSRPDGVNWDPTCVKVKFQTAR